MSTGHMAPVYDRTLKKTRSRSTAFVMHDESVRADLQRCDLSSQLRIFVQFVKRLGTVLDFGPFSCHRGALKRLGFHNPTFYILQKLKLPIHDRVAESLWKFFHAGRKSTLNMKNFVGDLEQRGPFSVCLPHAKLGVATACRRLHETAKAKNPMVGSLIIKIHP